MGAVWEAEHMRLPKSVAIKFLLGPGLSNPEALARFRREAEIASRLSHPHIVAVHDYNTLEDGTPYLVMEKLSGRDLRGRLDEGPLPLQDAREITRQVVSALSLAHREGVIHRDLKPENIFMCDDADGALRVKVLDFGISKLQDSATMMTQENAILGTPNYMAPEQAMGQHSLIDGRTDLFSLAVIFYEMLTGETIFRGKTLVEVLYKVTHYTPEPLERILPSVPPAVSAAVATALSKDPGLRQATVQAFVGSIEGHLQGPGFTQVAPQGMAPGFAGTMLAPGGMPMAGTVLAPGSGPPHASAGFHAQAPAGPHPGASGAMHPHASGTQHPHGAGTWSQGATGNTFLTHQPTPAASKGGFLWIVLALLVLLAGGGVAWWVVTQGPGSHQVDTTIADAKGTKPDAEPSGDGKADPSPQGDAKADSAPAGDAKADSAPAGDSKADPQPAGADAKADPTPAGDAKGDPQPAGDAKGDPQPAGDGDEPTAANENATDAKADTRAEKSSPRGESSQPMPPEVREAAAALAAKDFPGAIRLARRSLQNNKHPEAYLIMAKAYCGQRDVGGARGMMRNLSASAKRKAQAYCREYGFDLR